jgi:hypothetical protein
VFSPTRLIRRIEKLAPSSASASARKELYEELERQLGPKGFVEVLRRIASILSTPERDRVYWEARRKIESTLRAIARDKIVESFCHRIEFLEPQEVTCPHDRALRDCWDLSDKARELGDIEDEMRRPVTDVNKAFRRSLEGRRERLLEFFVKAGVREPMEGEFCGRSFRSRVLPSDSDVEADAMGPGRPPDRRQQALFDEVGDYLLGLRWSRRRAACLLQKILNGCFGVSKDPASVLRVWQVKNRKRAGLLAK